MISLATGYADLGVIGLIGGFAVAVIGRMAS